MNYKRVLFPAVALATLIGAIFFYFVVSYTAVAPGVNSKFIIPKAASEISENTEEVSAEQYAVALKEIRVGNKTVYAEVADTDSAQNTGLSGESSLNDDSGMLFVFKKPQKAYFWMKGMRFAIDIIWIKDGKIAGITENAETQPNVPDNQLKVYVSPVEVNYVLEVNSGFISRNGLKIGDEVKI